MAMNRFHSIITGYPGQPPFTLEPGDPLQGYALKLSAVSRIIKISMDV